MYTYTVNLHGGVMPPNKSI